MNFNKIFTEIVVVEPVVVIIDMTYVLATLVGFLARRFTAGFVATRTKAGLADKFKPAISVTSLISSTFDYT